MGQDIFLEKITPVGMSRTADLNSKKHITMLKTGLWEYIVAQLAAGEHPPITDRLQIRRDYTGKA